MKTKQKLFKGHYIEERLSDGFINATSFLNGHNILNGKCKRFKDFWVNQSTIQYYKVLQGKLNKSELHTTQRGKGGATWMQYDLFIVFYNWVNKLPNQSVTRDENTFVSYIREAFKDYLQFDTQKRFNDYYVDMYCPKLRLCIEFDEPHHKKSAHLKLDEQRQKEIEREHDVVFIRHDSDVNYSVTINKIIKFKESYNIVNAIKENRVPKQGLL